MKMEHALAKLILVCSLLTTLFASVPMHPAQAQTTKQAMPAGLQETFLSASAKPFSTQGGTYTTEYNGLNYSLNASGLQAQAAGLSWGIALRGMGRGNQAKDVQSPEIVQTDTRLEYQRGVITEWYRNTMLGVEQGFTISESPQGNGKLVLQLDLSANVEGILNNDASGLSFAGENGQTLRYDQLKAYDSNNVQLEAKMVYATGQIAIQVNDRGAAYPITIDPLIYLEQKVVSSDGTGENFFGFSVAISGETALVGAKGADRAYVFVRSGTTWTQQAILTGPANTYFGFSVAISGDTALVGAYLQTVGANSSQGSAYIFTRSGTTWIQQQELTASDGAASNYFGRSVALSGDTALVSARNHTVGANSGQGSAYVFTRSGATWTEQQELTASDGAAGDWFGSSVSLSGDTALVGAILDTVGLNSQQGSAYVFTRSGATWTQQQQLTASDGTAGDRFGFSAALSGDTAIVGGSSDTVGAITLQGSAYVFTRSGTTWAQQQQLTASDGASGDQFGYSVALLGDTALVGAYYDDVLYGDQGSAYFFVRNGTTWTQQTRLTASDATAFEMFGGSVALDGNTALVGTPYHQVGVNLRQGSVYFYQAYRTDADLAVSTVTGSGNPANPGDTVLLTASVTNYGPATAGNVMLNVSLPAGLTYLSHAATYGTYSPSTNLWNVGNLNFGLTAALTITATVDMLSAPTKTLTFSAQSLSRDTNDANNAASFALTVNKKQLLANGGFNTFAGATKIPTGWTAVKFASTDGKDTTAANRKEGTASLKITNTSAVIKTLTQTLSPLSGAAGDPFIFSYWVKGSALPAAGLCQAQVLFYNGAASVGTKTLACGLNGTFAYKQRKLTFTAPAAYTSVKIVFTYSKASGTVWFDLVSLLR
jgi:uncharacterized repeat protein (TIGR01451 family)